MSFLKIELSDWDYITICFNWIFLLILVAVIVILQIVIRTGALHTKYVDVNEITLGIGSSSVKLTYDKSDIEIAYKIWVELSTRKLGIPYDEENDVITEVYNSWYNFFGVTRELLKDIPANNIKHSSELISLSEKMLNMAIRPHLTKWQAKYRIWYEKRIETYEGTPQELQKNYEFYDDLIADLKETNQQLIEYKTLMQKIAFSK